MSKSALIIVDMVRDFTDPEGLVYYPQNREILPQIRKVLDKCRKKGYWSYLCNIAIEKEKWTEKPRQ